MKKKFEIWKSPEEQFGRLVDVADVRTEIDCSQNVIYVFGDGVTEAQVLAAYDAADHDDYERLSDWLPDSALVESQPGWINAHSNRLCYEVGFGFFTPSRCGADTYRTTEYWDGSNWLKIYEPGDDGEVIPVEYDPDSCLSLDERDSNGNYSSGTIGLHHDVCRLTSDYVLVIHWSQWQGDYTTAGIMDMVKFGRYCADCEVANPFVG